MSTFLLLTITGLGLGAMYFLIASGLSLIYGLMGVLNFAHGAFITVGGYGTWWFQTNVFDGVDSLLLRWLLSALIGLVLGGVVRGARRARPDPAALLAPHRAGARHGRAPARLRRALIGGFGADAKPYTVPPWLHDTTTVFGAHIPNDRWVEIATAVVVLALLQLFLRKTRYGLIIRAGVENRAMVQALGIDVRKAFTLVFAIGGIAAAIAGVLSGVYFNVVGPEQGTSLLIFAFIVVVIGGLGSIGGSAVAAIVVGADAAVHELLRLGRDRRHGRRAPARRRPAHAAARLRRRGGRERAREPRPRQELAVAARRLRAARGRAEDRGRRPAPLRPADRLARDARAARVVPRLRRARADVRHPVRLHRPAVVRPRALHRPRLLPLEHRDHRSGTGSSGRASSSRSRSRSCSPSCSASCRCARPGSRSRW